MSHWRNKLLVAGSMPRSKWPTENEYNDISGGSLSHNVLWGFDFVLSLTGPLTLYYDF